MLMRFCRSEPVVLRVKPEKGIVPFYAAKQGVDGAPEATGSGSVIEGLCGTWKRSISNDLAKRGRRAWQAADSLRMAIILRSTVFPTKSWIRLSGNCLCNLAASLQLVSSRHSCVQNAKLGLAVVKKLYF